MNPMPSAEDLESLVGDALGQISLDPFGLRFSFDRCHLAVEFRIEHALPDGTRHQYDCRSEHRPPILLHRLLRARVASVQREDLAFTLRFDDGALLTIHTELGPYECGHFIPSHDAAGLVVF